MLPFPNRTRWPIAACLANETYRTLSIHDDERQAYSFDDMEPGVAAHAALLLSALAVAMRNMHHSLSSNVLRYGKRQQNGYG